MASWDRRLPETKVMGDIAAPVPDLDLFLASCITSPRLWHIVGAQYFALSYLLPKQQTVDWSINLYPRPSDRASRYAGAQVPHAKKSDIFGALRSTKRVLREKLAAHGEECFGFCSGCVLHLDPDIRTGSEADPSRPFAQKSWK